MLADLVQKNRSFRRFIRSRPWCARSWSTWSRWRAWRLSGGNLQALKYFLSADPATNAKIFPTLRWAGYLKDWAPAENERPTAYIAILRDNDITTNFMIDHGISSELMRLAAIEKGIGSCLMGSIDRAPPARRARAAGAMKSSSSSRWVVPPKRPSWKTPRVATSNTTATRPAFCTCPSAPPVN
jgi:hypothetical protein